jgi:hypothetical protein
MDPTAAYQDHPLCWIASILCCLGILALLFTPTIKAKAVYDTVTFLPTYTLGILAWFLHGISLSASALIIPCAIQLMVLPILIRRSIATQKEKIKYGP